MKEEELTFLNGVIETLKKHRETLEKYEKEKEDNPEYGKKSKVSETIDKDIFAERGRLLKYYKDNQDEIDKLNYYYDMYISIYNVLTREENEYYTKADIVNYLKNSIVKSEYLDYEEDIISIIKDNLDDVDVLKEKFLQYGKDHGLDKLIELKELYGEELKRHQENIKDRYSNEFIHRKTKLFSMFTMLPKAVGLAVDKVKACIKEKKEARENLAKKEKTKKVLKAVGQVAATPIIFTGKWIIDHWYLLLLLLPRINEKRPKQKKSKEKDQDPDREQEQEAVAYSPAVEEELERLKEKAHEEGWELPGIQEPVPVPAKVREFGHVFIPGTENGQAVPSLPGLEKLKEAIQSNKVIDVPIAEGIAKGIEAGQANIAPAFNFHELAHGGKVPEEVNNALTNIEIPPIIKENIAALSKEKLMSINETCKEFINSLEESGQYNFFVASNHPNITIVHSAEEFIEAAQLNIKPEEALRIYLGGIPMGVKASERPIIWPEAEENLSFFENEKDLAEKIMSGEDENLSSFYNQYVMQNGEKINNVLGDSVPSVLPYVVGEDGKYYIKKDGEYVEYTGELGSEVTPFVGLVPSLLMVGEFPGLFVDFGINYVPVFGY